MKTTDRIDAPYKPLAKLGSAAAFLVLALLPLQIAVFVAYPPPVDPKGWFALFERHPFIGLVDMDLLMMVDIVVVTLTFAALAVTLRRERPLRAWIALSAQLVAVAAYIASNPALEMLALAKRYTAADDVERVALVGAGHAMLTTWQGTAFSASYLLSALATLCISTAMWRSVTFGRTTAVVGVIYGALSLVPSSAGSVGYLLSLVSLAPMTIWLALVGRRLWQLGRGTSSVATTALMPA